MTPERRNVILKGVGLGLFGLSVFAVSFVYAFPYDRVKEQLIGMAASQSLDMTVGKAGPVFGLGIALDEVMLRTRPEPGKKASALVIDRASVHASPLAMLQGAQAYELALDTLAGQITADVKATKERGLTDLSVRQIDMAQLPGVKETINLPLGGLLDLNLDFVAPSNRNAEGNGTLDWKWAGMVVGDGKEKLKIAGNPLMAEGITLPRVRFGDFGGKVVFNKGVGRLQGVGARSPDAEVRIEGEVRLADPLAYTQLDLYVTFKFSEALLKSADKLQLMLQFAESMGKRGDGFFGFRLTGAPGRFAPIQWQKTSPFTSGAAGGRASLTPPPALPGGRASLTPPPPPPPAAAPALLPPPAAAPDPDQAREAMRSQMAAAGQAEPTQIQQPVNVATERAPVAPAVDQHNPSAVPPNANVPRYVTSPPRE
jgi:type II secretion system protein N